MKANPTRSAVAWNDPETLTETFSNFIAVHYPLDFAAELIYQTLHIMGVKCQMFINVIRAST